METNRAEPRYQVKEEAFLWDFQHTSGRFTAVKITEVSRNGMRLELPQSLALASEVAIDYRGMIFCGSVRHCESAGDQYTLGIRIEHVLDPIYEQPPELAAA